MKTLCLLLVFALLKGHLYSQQVYFGYPQFSDPLDQGVVILVNLPENIDGRFIRIEDLDPLVELLKRDSTLRWTIRINIVLGDEKLSLIQSQSLSQNLTKILVHRKVCGNYQVVGEGRNKPILTDATDPRYRRLNSRLEIELEYPR